MGELGLDFWHNFSNKIIIWPADGSQKHTNTHCDNSTTWFIIEVVFVWENNLVNICLQKYALIFYLCWLSYNLTQITAHLWKVRSVNIMATLWSFAWPLCGNATEIRIQSVVAYGSKTYLQKQYLHLIILKAYIQFNLQWHRHKITAGFQN